MEDNLLNMILSRLDAMDRRLESFPDKLASLERVATLEGRVNELEVFKGKLLWGLAVLSTGGGLGGHFLGKLISPH